MLACSSPVCLSAYRLSEVGALSASQLCKGLDRMRDSLDDYALDNPAAKERYAQLMELMG